MATPELTPAVVEQALDIDALGAELGFDISLDDLAEELGFDISLDDLEVEAAAVDDSSSIDAVGAIVIPAKPKSKPVRAPDANAKPSLPVQQVETLEPPFYHQRNELQWRDTAFRHGTVNGDYGVTLQELEAYSLGPKYQVQIDNRTDIIMSDIFEVGPRDAVIGYVVKYKSPQDGGGLESMVARTFYQSRSQGVWRYLPTRNPSWYHKGHGEDSLALPAKAQAALSEIRAKTGKSVFNNPLDAERMFAGTTKNIDRAMDITYFDEVERKPKKLRGNFYGSAHRAINPSRVEFLSQSNGDEPDFEANPQIAWKAHTDFAEDVTFESVISRNGKYSYVFGRTKQNRAWLCYVEDQSDVRSMGVRETWVTAGDLAMPIVEYAQQAAGYGSASAEPGLNIKSGYVNMWPKYLKNVPVIQRYIDSRKK